MGYKASEQDLIAYLYGELEGIEKETMEQYLLEHAEARAELEKLKQLRSDTGSCKRQGSDCTSHISGRYPAEFSGEYTVLQNHCQYCSILLIIMMAAKFSGLQVRYGEGEMRISFSDDQPAKTGRNRFHNSCIDLNRSSADDQQRTQ